MTQTPGQDALQTLVHLGLITARMRENALRHARANELQRLPGSGPTLLWLKHRGIISDIAFADLCRRHGNASLHAQGTGDIHVRARIIAQVRQLQATERVSRNRRYLRTLVELGLLGTAVHDAALPTLPHERVLMGPAGVLVWLRHRHLLSEQDWTQLDEAFAVNATPPVESAAPSQASEERLPTEPPDSTVAATQFDESACEVFAEAQTLWAQEASDGQHHAPRHWLHKVLAPTTALLLASMAMGFWYWHSHSAR